MIQLLRLSTSLKIMITEILSVTNSLSPIFQKELKPSWIIIVTTQLLYLQTVQRRKVKLVGEVPPRSFFGQIQSIFFDALEVSEVLNRIVDSTEAEISAIALTCIGSIS